MISFYQMQLTYKLFYYKEFHSAIVLDIQDCGIADGAPLAGFIHLEELNVAANKI